MTDLLIRAGKRIREQCVNCLPFVRYMGSDDTHHRFICTRCDSDVLFDRVAENVASDLTNMRPVGGALLGGPHTDITPPEAA